MAICDKVLVVTIHTNDLSFLKLQYELLKQHMKVPFDFVVGFDKPENEVFALGKIDTESEIRKYCEDKAIPLYVIPKSAHTDRNRFFFKSDLSRNFDPFSPAIRCADSVQYMLSMTPWQGYRALLLLDADMFPIKDVISVPVDRQSPFQGVYQVRRHKKRTLEYMWNGIFWLSGQAPFSHLINFDLVNDRRLRTDVGGQTSVWIKALDAAGIPGTFMPHLASGHWGRPEAMAANLPEELLSWLEKDFRNESAGRFFAELYANTFLHYRGGSNWQNRHPADDLRNRAELVKAVVVDQTES